MILQGFSIVADLPTWLLPAILPGHSYVAGLWSGVVFFSVVQKGLGILADLPA